MEKTCQRRFLILEDAAQWAASKFRESRLPFLSAFLFGLLAYAYAFTNKLPNHDEVHSLFMKGATVDSGRWGLGFLDSIFPNYSMPWLYGIFTLFFMAVSVCLILRVFSIDSKLLQILLAGNIVVFPSLIGLFGYMFASCSYALSFLLAVLAVFLLKKGTLFSSAAALGCLILSLSIYQSYVSVAASLLVLLLIQQLLQEDQPLPVLKKGLCYAAFLILALGLYFSATQIVLKITGTSFNAYASGSITLSLSSLLESTVNAYIMFIRYFTLGTHALIPTGLSRTLHFACLLACGVLLLVWVLRNRKSSLFRFGLLALLVAVLPLAINCMYLITAPESIHTLVLYGFIGVYLFLAIALEAVLPRQLEKKIDWLSLLSHNVITLSLALILLINTYIANESYLHLHLRYENAYAFYTSLMTQIQQNPAFDENTRLAVIGTYDEPDFYEGQFPFVSQLTGIKGFLPDSYSNQRFLEYYLGFPVPFASPEEAAAIQASSEFAQMPVYPYYGSMQLIGDTFVVRLS